MRLPPDENGLIALLCAPKTVQAKRASALSPVDAASAGISGKSAGATTPVVELKNDMNAATTLNATGTSATATFEPIHDESASIVPALTATAMSIPAPAIIMIVFQGTRATASFCGASFIISAITAKIIPTSPTSILLFSMAIVLLPGIMLFMIGNIRSTTIIMIISVNV